MLDTTKPVQWKELRAFAYDRWMVGHIVHDVAGVAVQKGAKYLVSYYDMSTKYDWIAREYLTNYPTAPIPEPTK